MCVKVGLSNFYPQFYTTKNWLPIAEHFIHITYVFMFFSSRMLWTIVDWSQGEYDPCFSGETFNFSALWDRKHFHKWESALHIRWGYISYCICLLRFVGSAIFRRQVMALKPIVNFNEKIILLGVSVVAKLIQHMILYAPRVLAQHGSIQMVFGWMPGRGFS